MAQSSTKTTLSSAVEHCPLPWSLAPSSKLYAKAVPPCFESSPSFESVSSEAKSKDVTEGLEPRRSFMRLMNDLGVVFRGSDDAGVLAA